jgi:hypothetical protein
VIQYNGIAEEYITSKKSWNRNEVILPNQTIEFCYSFFLIAAITCVVVVATHLYLLL